MNTLEDIILADLENFSKYLINSSNLRNYKNMSSEDRNIYCGKLLNMPVEKNFIDNINMNTCFNLPSHQRSYKALGLSLGLIKRMCHVFYEKEYYKISSIPPQQIDHVKLMNKEIMNRLDEVEECFKNTTGLSYMENYEKESVSGKEVIIKEVMNQPLPYDFIKLLTDFMNKGVIKALFYKAMSSKINGDVNNLTYRDLGITENIVEQIFNFKKENKRKYEKEEKFVLLSDMLDKMYEEKRGVSHE